MIVRLLLLLMLAAPALSAQDAQVADRIAVAESLLATGAFESCYDTVNIDLDTLQTSPEATFDAALIKMICARAMRSGRRTRRALRDVSWAHQRLPDTMYRYADFLLESAYTQSRIGQWDAARNWAERCDALGSTHDRFQGYLHLIKANIAQYADGDMDEAGNHYAEGLNRLVAAGATVSREAAQCYKGLGWYARNTGDFEEGVRAYQQEIQVLREMYSDSNFEVAAAHYNLGNIYYEMGEWQNALDAYLTAHPVWTRTYAPGARFLRFLNEAIGDMYWELGQYPRAVYYYDLSIEGEESVNNDLSEAMALTGDTSVAVGNYDAALQYYQRALAWRNTHFGADHPLTGACNNYVARVYKSKGMDSLALHTYHRSLFALSAGFRDSSVYRLPTLEQVHHGGEQYVMEALEAKADLLWQMRHADAQALDAAWHHLELAMAIIDRVRQNPITEASKLFWSERAFPVYERAMEVALALDREGNGMAEAFRISERSKAFVLLSAMQSASPEVATGIPEALMMRERRLREDLETYGGRVLLEEKRCGDVRDKKLDSWKRLLQQRELEYDRFLDSVQVAYPAYYRLKYDVQVVALEDLQAGLRPQEAALVFFEGERHLFAFAVTPGDVQLLQVPRDSTYSRTLAALHRSIQQPGDPKWKDHASTVYSEVVGPLLALAGNTRALVIIPDGALSYLPFEIFEPGFENGQWVDHYSTRYAQSATVLLQARERIPGSVRRPFVGFAPDYGGAVPGVRSLGPLKYNTVEVMEAAAQFERARTFSGSAATKENFIMHAGSAAILHLAMHAQIDEETPLLSRLVFSTDTLSGEGQVYAYELQALDLKAQLAVLSACNTGTGRLRRGEGVMSMARSLQYAGCPSIATTLWSVDDLASSQLMTLFLGGLATGLSKSEALQRAKQAYLEQADPATAHPFYWAGFTLIGNDGPITFGPTLNGAGFALIAFLVLVLVWVTMSGSPGYSSSSSRRPASADL